MYVAWFSCLPGRNWCNIIIIELRMSHETSIRARGQLNEGQAAQKLQGKKGEEVGVGDVCRHMTIMISIQKVLDDRLNSL
jgi:hypothetical protein